MGCFITSNATLLGYGFQCAVLDQQNVQITYSGDQTLMTLQWITYSLTIKSVLNPSSVIPLTYTVQTKLKSVVNTQSSFTYSLANVFPLSISSTKSNNTFDQPTNLTVNFTQNYYPFDVMMVYINKTLFNFSTLL